MADYLRRRRTGGTYFFTMRLADRGEDLLIRHVGKLRRAMRDTLDRHPFRIDAIVVLPAAIHTIWTLPEGDSDFPNRIGVLKSRFSRVMPMPPNRSLKQIERGEKGIWQKRYWEHLIRDHADFTRHRDLIHLSPVHAGLCPRPQDWPHSSIHRALAQGHMPPAPIGHGAAGLHLTLPLIENDRPKDRRTA